MAGTSEGGKKSAQKTKELYGADFYKRVGAKGGATPTSKPKGFAAVSPEKRREWGKKGGSISRRGKSE